MVLHAVGVLILVIRDVSVATQTKKCVSSGYLERSIILPLTENPNCVGLCSWRERRDGRETERLLKAAHTCLAYRKSFMLSISSE